MIALSILDGTMTHRPLNKSDEKRAAKQAVPAWARGVWKRTRLRHEDGIERSTRVIWVQTLLLYADIRVPGPKDEEGREEGFSGHLEVRGQICSWQRPIDLHPVGEHGDEGAMFRVGDDMLEAGIHANYVEDWKLIGAPDPHLAMTRGAACKLTAAGLSWPAGEPLEIVVACDGHIIHAWRQVGGDGLCYHVLNPQTDALRPRYTVGTPRDVAAGGSWRVWSTSMDERGVAALCEMLD